MTHSCELSTAGGAGVAGSLLGTGTVPIHPPSCAHTHDVKDRD